MLVSVSSQQRAEAGLLRYNPDGPIRQEYAYDLMNREIRRIERDGGVQRTVYDRNGRVVRLIRPNEYDAQTDGGEGFQFTYDAQGRVLTVLGPEGQVLQTNTRNASRAVTCAQKNVGPHSGPTFLH